MARRSTNRLNCQVNNSYVPSVSTFYPAVFRKSVTTDSRVLIASCNWSACAGWCGCGKVGRIGWAVRFRFRPSLNRPHPLAIIAAASLSYFRSATSAARSSGGEHYQFTLQRGRLHENERVQKNGRIKKRIGGVCGRVVR